MAFGTPDIYPWGSIYAQVHEMPQYPTLKEALIHALVEGKAFEDYFDGDFDTWLVAYFNKWTTAERH